ncbi:hypothetical protein EBR03_00315 [bacterium]|nr:hypothetical protein [bacterium]
MSQYLFALGLGIGAVLIGCSSSSSEKKASSISPVLEAVDDSAPAPSPVLSAQAEKVIGLLTALEYQGVGLELEDASTLEFVYQVFSSTKTHRRKIQFVYTGLQLSYDKEQASLTLGEDHNVFKTLQFIEKNVPLR